MFLMIVGLYTMQIVCKFCYDLLSKIGTSTDRATVTIFWRNNFTLLTVSVAKYTMGQGQSEPLPKIVKHLSGNKTSKGGEENARKHTFLCPPFLNYSV